MAKSSALRNLSFCFLSVGLSLACSDRRSSNFVPPQSGAAAPSDAPANAPTETPFVVTETTLASVGDGGLANGASFSSSISEDGRFIAFQSLATNLVANDTNGQADIFVRDLQQNTTVRASLGVGDVGGESASTKPSISSDGRFVAFESFATNLVANDTNGLSDIFMRDLQQNTTVRVSLGERDVEGNGSPVGFSIAGDGRFVAFTSAATNLVANDTNGVSDIFVRDLQQNTTVRVSLGEADGEANGGSSCPSISRDGRIVAFASAASNLVANDSNSDADIFVRDLQLNTTVRVSLGEADVEANDESFDISVSGDGRFVAFRSRATNLVANDTNGLSDIFVRDLQQSTTVRANLNGDGGESSGDSSDLQFSGDGMSITFTSTASDLVANPPSGFQVYVTPVPGV